MPHQSKLATDQQVIIGLDFGMTYSLLTYYDRKAGPRPFCAAGGNEFGIRTAVSDPDQPAIRRFLGNSALIAPNFKQNFKIGLANSGTQDSRRRNNASFKTTQAFLEKLFFEFRKSHQLESNAEIDRIVATIPESWISGTEQAGREAFLHIFRELGLPEPMLVSEPVAAACFFAERYHTRMKQYFNGHILVYDHGGGTLDMSIVRLDGSRVEVVTSLGLSLDMTDQGYGGVAFDNMMLQHMSKSNPTLALLRGKKRDQWLQDFERMKKLASAHIEQYYIDRNSQETLNTILFRICDNTDMATDIYVHDIVHVFDKQFAPPIKEKLDSLVNFAQMEDTIHLEDASRFRVVAVGGFSEFYPVSNMLDIFFAERTSNADTTKIPLKVDERWVAISKGACLISAGQIDYSNTCPFTFGLVSYLDGQPHYLDLMKQNDPLSHYCDPIMLEPIFQLTGLTAGLQNSVVFYIYRAGERILLPMNRDFSKTLPDFDNASNWQIGCAIKGGGVQVYIRSNTGRSRTIMMGRFFKLVDGNLEETILDQQSA